MGATVLATYRVQLHAGFTFDDAAALAGYLADLGVSHLYCSPYLQAAPGSTHGYDVVDYHRLSADLGGEEAHGRMVDALSRAGLGQVLDIVPNHMAVAGPDNAWWWDVLENGPSSRFASYFDIDWDPPERKLVAQVLVPILGDHYGRVLEAGELAVERGGAGSFTVRYHEHELPLSPRTLGDLVARAAGRLGAGGGDGAPASGAAVSGSEAELGSLAHALNRLPHALVTDRASVVERHRDKEVLRQRLADLCSAQPAVALALDEEVKALNDDVEALDELLERQNYRLAYWRTAGRELDYRRFFDISTLVALRTEVDYVFDDVHLLVVELVRSGVVEGLRVDHVDGLLDPAGYLERLRSAVGPGAHLVVEKILEGDEELCDAWPVEGTSGYDFLAQVNDLLVDPAGEEATTAAYQRFSGAPSDFAEITRQAKDEIMRTVLAADVERLTEQFTVVAERHRRYRDHTRSELREALRAMIAAFTVYRTYVRRGHPPGPADIARVEEAAAAATSASPALDPELFRFLADVLLLRHPGEPEAHLAERFQQVSAPVMAKAVEDTAFYRYLRLVALNEVGGDPGRFGGPVADFHRRRLAGSSSRSLLATSTHDTKRSEDVRARLAALSEIPGPWEEVVWRWAQANEGYRCEGVPDRATEFLLYQTVVGAWPLGADRAASYLEKATKEAKVRTSWVDPDPVYDGAVAAFAREVLGDSGFLAGVEEFLSATGLVAAGRLNSLAQVGLKLTSPGIPDLYQGSELWDLSLVDPDNRRPVDYDRRRRLLAEARDLDAAGALARMEEGTPKLWMIERLLGLRRRRPELFAAEAGYRPLTVAGTDAERVVAFARAGDRMAVTVTRFPLRGDLDGETAVELPPGRWTPVLGDGPAAGGQTPVASLVRSFPVSVLVREDR